MSGAAPPAPVPPAAAQPAAVPLAGNTAATAPPSPSNTCFNFTLAGIDAGAAINFDTADWEFPEISGFSHHAFWELFASKHSVSNTDELIEIILDLARFHFSPKVAGLPGVTVTVTSGTETRTFRLEKGKTKCRNFARGKGAKYSFTAACLATAGIFEQAFHSNATGIVACRTIAGNHDGYTQLCGTLDGWTQADQDLAQAAFSAWITTVGAKERDPKVDTSVRKAAAQGISRRITTGPSAFSMRNVMLKLTGGILIPDLVTKNGAASNTKS